MRISDGSSDVCSSDLLAAQEYRFAIASANLGQQVRNLFALGVAARDNLELARDTEIRARKQSRVARELVDAGKAPRSEGRRVGKEFIGTCRYRWSPFSEKQINNKENH